LTLNADWAILNGMKTITIKVPDGVFQWLAATARRQKQTEAEVARAALAAAAAGKEPSLADLVADLKGIGQGKYTDLSTNKKHLDDFGR
jgi:predicted transcriptional regulator